MADGYRDSTLRGATHTLSRSTMDKVKRQLSEFNAEVDGGSISIDDYYDLKITLYPGGYDGLGPMMMTLGIADDDPLATSYLELSVKRDPTGFNESGKCLLEASVFGILLNGQKVEIDVEGDCSWSTEQMVDEEGVWMDLGNRQQFRKFDRIQFKFTIETKRTNIASEIATTHWGQLQRMYENSKKCGDITLRIITKKENPDSAEPPRKRRKTDGNETVGIGESRDVTMRTSSIALRSASTVFESVLNNKMKEREERAIEIHAENAKDVDDMIYYIMVHDLRKDASPLTLIKLAHLYQLPTLLKACSARITQDLTPRNFIESVNTFHRYEIEDGYEELVRFGRVNFRFVKRLSGFKDLHFSFKYFLKSQMVEFDWKDDSF